MNYDQKSWFIHQIKICVTSEVLDIFDHSFLRHLNRQFLEILKKTWVGRINTIDIFNHNRIV